MQTSPLERRLRLGDHLCMVYETRAEQLAVTTPFIKGGLANRECCAYIADDSDVDELITVLIKAGVDVEQAQAQGALRFLTARDTYLRAGTFHPETMLALLSDHMQQALADGFTGFRVTGEMTWALSGQDGCNRLIEYEALLDQFLLNSKALALCQYHRHRFTPAVKLDVLRTHPMAVLGDVLCENVYYESPDLVLREDRHAERVSWMMRQLKRSAEQGARRRRAEETLRDHEEKFRQFAEHVSNVFWMVDPVQPKLLFISQAYETIWGRSCQSLYDEPQSFLEYVHHDDRPAVRSALQRHLQGDATTVEYRVLRPDGSVRWVLDRAFPIRDVNGRVYRVAGIAEDITDRKRAEHALRDSEERFRATFDQAAIGVAHIGLDNQTYLINPGLCAMLGYTDEELLQCTFIDVTHPDDIRKDCDLLQQLLDGKIPSYRIEKRYLHKNGAVVWGDLAVSLLRGADGKPNYIVGVVVDITQRKLAEARLEAVLTSINDHLVTYDRHWRYTFVNDQAAQVLRTPKDELLGKCIWDIFPDAVGNQYYQELHTAFAEQRVIRSEHYYAPFDTWFENHIYPSPDGVTVFSANITWRKHLEQELHRRAEELTVADQRKDEFLATLAHELRNPLAPIRNALEALRVAGDDEAIRRRATATMDRQVSQMVRLIDDLLDVSRITRDKLELRKEWIDAAVAVQNAVEAARPLFDSLEQRLTVTVPQEPIYLHADLARLSQIFSNLLTNASKYTEPGGQIALTAARRDNELVVQVRDTGIGIPPDQLAQVFDLFVQVDRSLERSQGGLGIGLTLVKRLVDLHGGSVQAHSDGFGKGSEFTVRLPLEPLPQHLDLQRDDGGMTLRPIRSRILVADDNQDSAESLALLLRIRGADVRTAHHGMEALNVAAGFRPDVILLDIGMPELNGYDVARQIRSQPWAGNVLLIAMTGWGQQEDKRRAMEAGFNIHLTKPIDPLDLEKLLVSFDAKHLSQAEAGMGKR